MCASQRSCTPPAFGSIISRAAVLVADASKSQSASRNGKRSDSGLTGSFFTWFIVLALLGVWTSVAVVYFDLVDYQGVLGEWNADL